MMIQLFQNKDWRAVSHWVWDVPENEVCGICRNHFEAACQQCKMPGDDCPLSIRSFY